MTWARGRASRRRGGLPVGVGAAGVVDLDGRVRYAPNIDWADYPLRAELEALLDVAVTVDNDANAAAWGEYAAGAAAAASSVVMLTVGTGVGGGLIIDGRLVRGAGGLGAEFGHLIVSEGGPRCPCGNHGCLEALASGNAIGRVAREALQAGRTGARG
ncbi:MAG TPA: ROK family protein [Egibacteraceae bacterium]|nr:ROK family protein [Egibacteraceae bacterium]